MKKETLACLLAAGLIGCGPEGADQSGAYIPPEEDDLVVEQSKVDTGYYSNLSMELEGEFVSQMNLDLSAETPEARTAYAERLKGSTWELRSLVDSHVKFAKTQLNTEKLHLNLTSDDVQAQEIVVRDTKVWIPYSIKIETIVSFEELQKAGIDPNSLAEKNYAVKVPADPRNVFAKAGERCATGFDAGSLADYNYFYYFDYQKQGCDLDLVDGLFTVKSLLPKKTTYPEYDRLAADGKVEVVVFFGAAEHGWKPGDWDWGVNEHGELTSALRSRSFQSASMEGGGVRYTRTRNGVSEIVDVFSPADLTALDHDTDGLFVRMLKTHEVVVYNGHSFYGSLNVLDQRENYPEGVYQILFIDSCWSYEYYTKQVFRNKATAQDPNGWDLADVVNDTESGWFHNNAEETRILLTNIFAGVEALGRDAVRDFNWSNIIEAMNKHALDSQQSRGTETHEIFGVSGVRTNKFDPDKEEEPQAGWTKVDSAIASDHDYADDTQKSWKIESPAGATALRIHFAKLETEENYDFVQIYDEAGKMIVQYSGHLEPFTTEEIAGAGAEIRLVSDYSISDYGFDVDYFEYR